MELVGFFLVGCAGGGPDLGFVFPAGVFGGPGDEGFGGVGEGEKGLGAVEHGFDLGGGDAVVDEDEEAVGFSGQDQLLGYLFDSIWEVMEGDFGDRPVGVFGFWCHGFGRRGVVEGLVGL